MELGWISIPHEQSAAVELTPGKFRRRAVVLVVLFIVVVKFHAFVRPPATDGFIGFGLRCRYAARCNDKRRDATSLTVGELAVRSPLPDGIRRRRFDAGLWRLPVEFVDEITCRILRD